jgi:hypothetical protein
MKKKQKNRWHAFDDDRIEEYWEEEGLLDDNRDYDDDDDADLADLEDDFELIEGPTDDPPFPEWKQHRRKMPDD